MSLVSAPHARKEKQEVLARTGESERESAWGRRLHARCEGGLSKRWRKVGRRESGEEHR